MSPEQGRPQEQEHEPIVVHDRRRLDPQTGEVRPGEQTGEVRPDAQPGAASPEAAPAGAPGGSREEELLADLQRVTAEYANYRKRADRDRLDAAEAAVARLLEGLLPLLDAVDLARQHGDLEGPFKGVGEGLEAFAERQGLERLGKVGDVFDPTVHHALMQAPEDPEASVPVVAQVLQPGWRLTSGRVLRAAGVAVAEPGAPVTEPAPEPMGSETPDTE